MPFYISTPKKDQHTFKNELGNEGWSWIADEDIDQEGNGWKNQQIIKSQFWKLNLCENYVCIDSDSQFIKPFYLSDFMYNEEIPYTICHQQKQLFDWSIGKLPFNPIDSFKKDRKLVMDLFDRKWVFYDFGPSPTIWSKKVWESLEENYIKTNNLTFSKLIDPFIPNKKNKQKIISLINNEYNLKSLKINQKIYLYLIDKKLDTKTRQKNSTNKLDKKID